MRLLLRDGSREILIFPRRQFLGFDRLAEAAEYVASLVDHPRQLEALRSLLADDPDYAHLTHTEPAAVVTRVAHMVTTGRVHLLADPEALPPWSWPFPLTPTHPQFDAGADAEASSLTGEDDGAGEEQDERVDAKPEPIVPPEYPRLARLEAEATETETERYSLKLELLKFFGLAGPPGSAVKDEYPRMAATQGVALRQTAGAFGSALMALVRGGDLPEDSSAVSRAIGGLARTQGKAVTGSAEDAAEALREMFGPAGELPGGSALAKALAEAHGDQGQKLLQAALGTSGGMPQATAFPPAPAGENWLRFRMVDDVTGEPIAGARLRLRLANGEVLELESDADGLFSTAGLPEGNVDLLGVLDDEAYEVIGVFTEDGE